MRSKLGAIVTGASLVAWVVFGLWGFLLNLAVVHQAIGFWGVLVGFLFFPATLVAAPWYAGIAWGNWFPVTITYGGFIVAAILYSVGNAISGDDS